MRFLIIDDDLLSLETLAKSLQLFGHEVEFFSNPALAVLRFAEGLIVDMIITDFSMPELDGLGVIEKIREINSNIPIIVISAVGRHEDRLDEIMRAANKFISKPININELLDTVLDLGSV